MANRVQLTADAVVGGPTFDEFDRLTRSGSLRRVRRGAYESASASADPVERHRSLIEATIRQTPTPAVLSHQSAAVLHGLPVWNEDLARVHLTRDCGGKGKVRRYVHLHVAPVPAVDEILLDGFTVTSPARTVVDLCRTLPLERGVAAGDAALRAGVEVASLADVAARSLGWPGMGTARRALEILDPRSESVGESVSRVKLLEAGLPAPVPQLEVFDDHGLLVARSDFGWPQLRTLGEFDGRVKYGRLLKPGQTISDVVLAEKQREDALRDLGWNVVRWLWEDLLHPARFLARLERAFARGRASA